MDVLDALDNFDRDFYEPSIALNPETGIVDVKMKFALAEPIKIIETEINVELPIME